jgi:RING finger family protein
MDEAPSPQTTDAQPLSSSSQATVCAICQAPISPGEPVTPCPGCKAEYHAECWTENKGCAIYGCSEVPATEGRAAVETPVAYWGQEYKPCPVCNAQILAAAVRCRQCGSVFQTARPLGSAEFSIAASQEAQAPRLRRTIIWLFILCVVPFTAPVAAVIGLIWRHSHQEEIRKLPSLYSALAHIGVGVGIFQTVAIVIVTVLFTLLRS